MKGRSLSLQSLLFSLRTTPVLLKPEAAALLSGVPYNYLSFVGFDSPRNAVGVKSPSAETAWADGWDHHGI